MDFNVELSKTINRAMLEFDSLRAASGDTWAEAMADNIDIKVSVLGLLTTAAGFVIVTQASGFLSQASLRLGLDIERNTFFIGGLAALFVGTWVSVLRSHRRTQARNLASIGSTLMAVVAGVQAVADAVRPQFGMLSANLMDVHRRMVKTFPTVRGPLAASLVALAEKAFLDDGFSRLAAVDSACGDKLVALRGALASAREFLASGAAQPRPAGEAFP